jgi:hypothetical protein
MRDEKKNGVVEFLSHFILHNSSFILPRTRQEGLEPPTGGFGDRYSTN